MPVSQSSLAATHEPTSLNHEMAAAHCAYRLIGQLRQYSPIRPALPRGNPSPTKTEHEDRPIRAEGNFVSLRVTDLESVV